MERKAFTNLMEASTRVLLGETHMVGKTVIVKGKKGKVVKQVSSDGKTESDEIYQVKFEDGTIEDIPARDMEMQGNISNRKEPSENELEDIVNEDNTAATAKAVRKHLKNKYPKAKIHVRSKGGKTRFIQATSDQGFGNDTRKGILSHSSPNAKVTNTDDISYGNISKNIISASTDHWASHIGLNEADKMPGILPYTQAQWAAHKAKELAPEELAISSERLVDTRKNIEKHLKSKKKIRRTRRLTNPMKSADESVELGELKMPPKSGGTPMQRYAKNTLDRRNYIKGEGGWIAPTMTPQQRLTQLKKAKTSHYENKPKVE